MHLSTLQTTDTAREDLQPSAHALADLSGLQSNSNIRADGTAGCCNSEGLDAKGDQRAGASSSSAEHTASQDTGSERCAKSQRKPHAMFLAYYNQALPDHLAAGFALPSNVALCSLPSASVACEDCIMEAELKLQQLFPELGCLFDRKGAAADDDSDDEAIEALTEALDNLGGQ